MQSDGITSEIHELIDSRWAAGVAVHTAFVVTEIMGRRANILGDDAPFYRALAAKELSRRVTKAIGRYAPEGTTDDQLLFPGFKHLSRAYVVVRNGDTQIVPIEQCTDAEIDAKTAALQAMGDGCYDHGSELQSYKLARRKGVAA